jgi:RNA-directed DNA polymerase
VGFERYADDVLVHCKSRAQAQRVLAGIEQRLRDLGMAVHPDKTRIVYCKDGKRRGRFPVVSFTFLGFMFCPRASRDRQGSTFLAFLPAISPQALKKISTQVRRWRLHRWIYHSFGEVARTINPVVAGWMQYYGRFYPSVLYRLLARINAYLVRWIRNKYRRYDATRAARRKFAEITSGYPRIFRHWRWVTTAW